VTTPAGPGVAVQQPPAPVPPVSAVSTGMIGSPEPPPGGRPNRLGWVLGLGVVGLVVVLGVALLVGRAGGGGPTTPAPPPSAAPSGQTFAPGTVRIVDPEAGISYPHLEGWFEWDMWPQDETATTAGQYFVTQENTPDQTTFIAQCTSGGLVDRYGWSGAASLQPTLAAVAGDVRSHYYPRPNELRVLRDEARTVDGHPGRLYEFQLSWDVSGYEATGERAALLLVDVGRPAPALLYISVPNTHAELYGVIDQVLDGVEVL
jgi:hypothetical protein